MSSAALGAVFLAVFWACASPGDGGAGDGGAGDGNSSASNLDGLEPGVLPDHWIAGLEADEPPIQVHAYNGDLYILRQSKGSHYEAPFMYLIFGEEEAILFDTGSLGDPPVRETVDRVLASWCLEHGREDIHLVVSHTHGHGDHRANDAQFDGRPNTTFVSAKLTDVEAHFGLESWPTQLGEYDLGNRVLDIIPTPGHHPAHIAIYDRRTGLLLSGDTFYPGFLFVFWPNSWPNFRDSTRRLAAFAEAHPVAMILGCHVEMTQEPKHAFAYGTPVHPDERVLPLTVEDLLELDAAVQAMGDDPRIEAHDSFIVYPAWKAERFGAPPAVDDETK